MELSVKYRQSPPQGIGDVIGQTAVQVGRGDAGTVSGFHSAQSFGGLPGQEILYGLGRGMIISAAQLEGSLLPVSLESNSGQRVVGAEVGGTHPHQKTAVDIFAVSGPMAHAVGYQPPLLRGGCYHLAAGTDAEGKGGAAVRQVAGQLVVGGGQFLPGGAKLSQRDSALGVLDAHADGKGLLFHGNAGLQQHLEGVSGGVAGGEDQCVTRQIIASLRAFYSQSGYRPIPEDETGELMAEAHVAAQADQFLSNIFDHVPQHVGTDVGLVLVQNVLRGSCVHQGAEHGGDPGIVGAGGQLTVGEGARAPLAELDVGGGVQYAGGPEMLHVGGALLHRAAPLQHNGGQAVAGQKEGGEEPGGAHAYHHRRQGRGPPHGWENVGGALVEGDIFVPAPGHNLAFIGRGYIHSVDVVDVALFPGVDGLSGQRQPGDDLRFHAQNAGGLFFQLPLAAVKGQGDILDAEHRVILVFLRMLVLYHK